MALKSKAFTSERAWSYILARDPCPPDDGRKAWIFRTVGQCYRWGIPEDKAHRFVTDACTTAHRRDEVARAIQQIYGGAYGLHGDLEARPPGEPTPTFDLDLLTRYASTVPEEITDDWLAEVSPECVLDAGPDQFLRAVYQPGEYVAIVVGKNYIDEKGKPQVKWRAMEGTWSHTEAPDALDYLRSGFRYQDAGIFYSCNPVREGSTSWSQDFVDSWRYGILESDEASAELWLRIVVKLHLPVVAIYTRGGQSVHVLYRIDAESKQDWDRRILPIKRGLVPLGADPAAMTAVRLTRLPGCWRGEKGNMQRLLYLNPEPTGDPIWTP
jgi:hypothetical protein